MSKPSSRVNVLLTAALLSLPLAAFAFEDRDVGVYVEGGRAPHGDGASANSVTLGVVVPWTPRQSVQGGAVSFYTDFFVSEWRAPVPSGDDRRSYAQLGALAGWRYRFNEGSSPWFFEAGIGGSVMNNLYLTPARTFSTRFQFTEQVAVGRNFGTRGEHELSLRLQHFSNAGIKHPNPGENFVRVRYLYRF